MIPRDLVDPHLLQVDIEEAGARHKGEPEVADEHSHVCGQPHAVDQGVGLALRAVGNRGGLSRGTLPNSTNGDCEGSTK